MRLSDQARSKGMVQDTETTKLDTAGLVVWTNVDVPICRLVVVAVRLLH